MMAKKSLAKTKFCEECFAEAICSLLNYTYSNTEHCLSVQMAQMQKRKRPIPPKPAAGKVFEQINLFNQ